MALVDGAAFSYVQGKLEFAASQPILGTMVDVFFMRPGHPDARRMKTRLTGKPGMNMQLVESMQDIGQLNPRPGSVFIFHLNAQNEIRELISQIASLSKKADGTTMSIVISDIKDPKLKSLIEGLPQTAYYTSERAAHDLDLLVQKIAKTQATVTQERRHETLTYTSQQETFIPVERGLLKTVTSETQIEPAKTNANNVFQPITDSAQKNLLVADAINSQAAVTLSNFGANDEVKGYLFDLDEGRDVVRCQIKGNPVAVAAFRQQSEASKKMALSVSLQQSRVFCVCVKFKWTKEATIEIGVPSLIYSVQRRRDFRLLCYPTGHQRVNLRAGDLHASYEIYDLSVGGVSILVGASEAAKVEAAADARVSLEIDGDLLDVGPVKYRQKQPFKDIAGVPIVKMGFSFEAIKTPVKNKIGSYVDRKGRAYFMDYMLESEREALRKS